MGASNAKNSGHIQYLTKQGYRKNHFQFKQPIGRGSCGRVWKVIEKKTQKTYALKVIKKAKILKNKQSIQSALNEKYILSEIEHQFIVNMHCSFQDRQNLYLLMDYYSGGDLRYYINNNHNFSEEQIKFIIRCLIEGLKYLHENDIIHRDIKPENIILDRNGYCRITDMGIAQHWKSVNPHDIAGTPGYLAPEAILGHFYSFYIDYYSVGIIAYELVMKRRPYESLKLKELKTEIFEKQAMISQDDCQNFSHEGRDFINQMIKTQSKQRLGYHGIQQIMGHPWLKITAQQSESFFNMTGSPIKTKKVTYHPSLRVSTIPDAAQKKNKQLLKKPETHQVFSDYSLTSQMKKLYKQSRMTAEESAFWDYMIKQNKYEAYSVPNRSVQSSLQVTQYSDILSFKSPKLNLASIDLDD